MPDARYIMIGGFLGAGKTTAMLRLAEKLVADGKRVGLITNDQSSGLVDTALARASGLPVEEITGGCFCCRFQSLMDAAGNLTRDTAPEVFLAEPVGSCTDLRASVAYPLRRLYGDRFSVAPMSVLVDPIRGARILGIEPGKVFAPKVVYVYRKQLEEADVIVINKSDLVSSRRLEQLKDALAIEFPRAEILSMSALQSQGLDPWFERVLGGSLASFPPPDLDYDTYAEGEAMLGWFNATVHVASPDPFSGNRLLETLASGIQRSLEADGAEIAHLKMTLTPDGDPGDIGAINLVRGDSAPFMAHSLSGDLEGGELIINLRAEGDPGMLQETVTRALHEAGKEEKLEWTIEHSENFRPARPVPTYRMAEA
ncbi:MAG TPA: GTP-binding protein [Bryobacteraceae bacterium]|nr:GTP-binding protein [Bryobacteraceae bacterium]